MRLLKFLLFSAICFSAGLLLADYFDAHAGLKAAAGFNPTNPGAIGGTTPGSGAFTTISATSTISPSQTSGIVGTTTNNSANAGSVGELITATAAPAAVSLSTGSTANVTSVSLTAGDWDCSGAINYTFGATTSITNLAGGASQTSATLPTQDSAFDYETAAQVPTGGAVAGFPIPVTRQLLASTTTVFLVTQATFTVSTLSAGGTLRCRRMR